MNPGLLSYQESGMADGSVWGRLQGIYEGIGGFFHMPGWLVILLGLVILALIIALVTLDRNGFFDRNRWVRILLGWVLGLAPLAFGLGLVSSYGIERLYAEEMALGAEGIADMVINGIFALVPLIVALIRTYDDFISTTRLVLLTPLVDALVIGLLIIPAAIAMAFVKHTEMSIFWTIVLVVGIFMGGTGGTVVVIAIFKK